jgi:hypothetical protein
MTRVFLFALILGVATVSVGCGDDDRGPGGADPDSGAVVRRDSGGITFMDSGTMMGTDGGPRPDSGTIMPRPDSGPRPDTGGMVMPGDGTVGSSCMDASDCTEGSMPSCQMSFMGFVDFPGGYCTAQCSATVMCPAGSECIMFSGMGFCGKTCTMDSECRTAEGYHCDAPPIGTTSTLCLPPGI